MLLLAATLPAKAQYTVTFQLKKLPSYHKAGSPVFVAGTFNNWAPGSSAHGTTGSAIAIRVPEGAHEYKFTQGSWQAGESGPDGAAKANRVLHVVRDTTIEIEISGWLDHFGQQARQSTASKNVHILDTAFFMPQLSRHRRIWVYLPESYAASRKKYAVLYMHDGQNLFDDKTAYAGEWGIDETLDTLGATLPESIVIGIDNGGEKRMNEYSPGSEEFISAGTYASRRITQEGDAYIDFIVKTLKPYIEKKYRIKRGRRYRAIAGSSMGGLISFYAMLRYPKVFGAAGVFSPAFWASSQLMNAIPSKARSLNGRIYFYAGGLEGSSMAPDMLAVFEQMGKLSKAKMTTVIRAEGTHSEAQWRHEFPLLYKWWMTQ